MKKYFVVLVTLFVFLTLSLNACTQAPGQPAAEEPAAASGEETLTIAFSVPDMAFPFFVFMETQVRDEAEKLGVEIVTLDGQNQVPKQTADLEAVIAQELDGVLISPLTADAMAPAVQQVVDAGIPVVTVDRTVFDVATLAHVGADNVLGGEQQGEALLQLFPDGTSIFELTGTPGSSPAIDRSAGLHNIIDDQAQIELACNQTAQFRRDQGLSVTENCLGATPNPGAVIAANDEMAFGAVEAAKAAGILDEVVVIGYDALPEALAQVQNGELYGTVEQFPGEQARTGLRTLVEFLRSGAEPAAHDIFITPKLITQDNLGEAERIAEIGGEMAAAPGGEGEPLTIAFSVPDMAFPFFVFMETQVRDEAEKLGVEIVTLDGQNQVPKQTADMKLVIARELDGVLISPLTADAMAPAVQQVVDAGIPVVTVDRTVFDVATLAHVGADNVLGGEQQGEALLQLFPDGTSIFELTGTPGSSPAIDRSAGLHNIIDDQAQIELACNQTAQFRRDQGLSVTENCLGATPNPGAVIAANDEMAFGAVEAAKAAGILDEVVVIGYDALPEALAQVQNGELYGTVEQFPGEQARTGLRTLVEFLRSGAEPAAHDIFITPKLITQDNLGEAERIAEIGGEMAAAPSGEGEPLTIAFSVPDMAFPFFVFMETQVRDEAEKLGVEIVTLDGQNQVPKQTADMESVIARELDGVLISPLTADAMAPAVQQVVDAGIPVVTVDRTVFDVATLAHVGADNVLGGEQQGEALLQLFPDGTSIFELTGTPGSSPAIDRSAGLHNIIDDQAQIELACNQTAQFRRDQGLSVTENCLGATPNPGAVIAANDEMAFGAVEAAKAAGILDEVVVIGYDALPEALAQVQNGELYGTVEQFPGEQARTGLRTLVEFLRSGAEPAAHDIFITPKLITQDNLNEAERIGEIQ